MTFDLKNIFDLKDIFDSPFVEADMDFNFKLKFDIPFLGKYDILDLRISGLRDDDNDFLPEFVVDLVVGSSLVVAQKQTIELDPALVMSALGKGVGGVPELFAGVFEALEKNGIGLPWEKK
jgi:hypothetical protein